MANPYFKRFKFLPDKPTVWVLPDSNSDYSFDWSLIAFESYNIRIVEGYCQVSNRLHLDELQFVKSQEKKLVDLLVNRKINANDIVLVCSPALFDIEHFYFICNKYNDLQVKFCSFWSHLPYKETSKWQLVDDKQLDVYKCKLELYDRNLFVDDLRFNNSTQVLKNLIKSNKVKNIPVKYPFELIRSDVEVYDKKDLILYISSTGDKEMENYFEMLSMELPKYRFKIVSSKTSRLEMLHLFREAKMVISLDGVLNIRLCSDALNNACFPYLPGLSTFKKAFPATHYFFDKNYLNFSRIPKKLFALRKRYKLLPTIVEIMENGWLYELQMKEHAKIMQNDYYVSSAEFEKWL